MGTLGIISLIVGAIAAIAGTAVSASSIHKTNETNKQIAAMQNQWNVEQWQRENAYNDPAQQVQRLAAAGINPSLAVGQSGLVDAGNAQSVHPAAGATMQPFQMDGSALSAPINQAAMLDSQIKANEAYAKNQSAQANETNQLLPEKIQQIRTQVDEMNQSVSNMRKQIEQMDSTIRNLDQNSARQAFDISHTLFLENLYDKQFDLDLRNFNEYTLPFLKSHQSLMSAQSEYFKGLERLNFRNLLEMHATFNARMLGLDLDNGLKLGKIDLNRSEVEKNTAYINLLGFDLETKQFNSIFTGQDWIMERPNAKEILSGANGASRIFSGLFVSPLMKPLETAGYGGFSHQMKTVNINHFKKK